MGISKASSSDKIGETQERKKERKILKWKAIKLENEDEEITEMSEEEVA